MDMIPYHIYVTFICRRVEGYNTTASINCHVLHGNVSAVVLVLQHIKGYIRNPSLRMVFHAKLGKSYLSFNVPNK